MDFKFDSRAFTKDLDREVRRAASSALDDIARDYEQRLSARYKGQPVDQITPALQLEWSKISNEPLTEPELTEYAQAISDGAAVEFRTEME